ncbi:MAG: cbb3-type cytochrome c oxidase subunit 3 [Rhodospirillales bacterium]|nr:cbb3-type cytochrome c oxidase subunit 3 [Rhodospirillales bacterium]
MSWFEIAMELRPWMLVAMCLLFLLLAGRALAPGRRARLEDAARIPLRDDR